MSLNHLLLFATFNQRDLPLVNAQTRCLCNNMEDNQTGQFYHEHLHTPTGTDAVLPLLAAAPGQPV